MSRVGSFFHGMVGHLLCSSREGETKAPFNIEKASKLSLATFSHKLNLKEIKMWDKSFYCMCDRAKEN
jgi:hypothetical protein